jgi:hypothetical protein
VDSYSWTIASGGELSISEVSGFPMKLEVQTNDKAHVGTFAVSLLNDLTYDSVTFNTNIDFTIEVIDPCTITTIHQVTLVTETIVLGETVTQDFAEATCQVEVDYPAFGQLCGTRQYVVVDGTDTPITWITVTGSDPYTITSSPTDESLVGLTHNYFLMVTFTDALYPTPVRREPLDITITSAVCDCTLLEWVAPSFITDSIDVALGPKVMTMPTATIDEASKLPTAAIRKCYENGA